MHRHDFAQVWYSVEGEFRCGGKTYGPDTFAYMADPHFEHEMQTETGGTVVFLQFPGPTTGARPIYAGRMNLKEPEAPGSHDLCRYRRAGRWSAAPRRRPACQGGMMAQSLPRSGRRGYPAATRSDHDGPCGSADPKT